MTISRCFRRSRGERDAELLVGTKKGLFVLTGDAAGSYRITTRAFPGDVVEYAIRDRRSGRYFASVTPRFYGPRLRAPVVDGETE